MGTPYAGQLAGQGAASGHGPRPRRPDLTLARPRSQPGVALPQQGQAGRRRPRREPDPGHPRRARRGVDLRRCGLYEPGLAATFDPLHRFVADLGLEPYDVPARQGELKYLIVTHSPDGEHLVRFVLRSERHLDDLRTALPRLLRRPAVGPGGHREPAPRAQGGARGRHRGRAHRAVPAAGAGRRRHTAARPEVVLPDQHRGGRLALPAGPGLGRRADPAVVWDLYCGVGGFALHATAPGRTVLGVETSAEAVDAGVGADADAVGRHPRRPPFEVGDATTAVPSPAPDLVVVNPPAAASAPSSPGGSRRSSASQVIYSSCNVESLARDLAAMPSLPRSWAACSTCSHRPRTPR